MLTGELRNQIDSIWNDFWSGGLANPLQVIEQITYLIFIKRLDEMQELEERKANTLGKPIERIIFPQGKDESGEPYANLRWSHFKHFAGPEMFRIVDEHVFPFIRELKDAGTSYARHMRDARFQIPGPALLAKVVDKLDKLDMGDRDTKGDVYEYMLAKIATAGQNGQFRTPRHIIATMVELVEPKPEDVICDPACGTCGFLVAAGEYLRKHHPALFRDDKLRRHWNRADRRGAAAVCPGSRRARPRGREARLHGIPRRPQAHCGSSRIPRPCHRSPHCARRDGPEASIRSSFTDFDRNGVEGVFEKADVVRVVQILRDIEPRIAA
jgi:hypothetical protein